MSYIFGKPKPQMSEYEILENETFVETEHTLSELNLAGLC